MKRKITISLRNTSLAEALHVVITYAGCRVEPSRTALMICLPIISVDPVVIRTIPLAGAPGSEVDKMHKDPIRYFKDFGVIFDSRSSCHFEDKGSTLVVNNTHEQLELIRAVLDGLTFTGF